MNELSTVITEKHVSIADTFVSKIYALLAVETKSIETYGVQVTDYAQYERITLKIDEGRTIEIQLRTGK